MSTDVVQSFLRCVDRGGVVGCIGGECRPRRVSSGESCRCTPLCLCAVRNTHSLCAIAGTWHNLAHTRHIAGWSDTQLAEHGLQLEPGGAAGRSQDRGPDGETEGRRGYWGGGEEGLGGSWGRLATLCLQPSLANMSAMPPQDLTHIDKYPTNDTP